MRRVFWIAFGAVAGVLVVRRVSRTLEAYSPQGVGRSLASVGDGLRELAEVVREGMAEREQELRAALGVDVGDVDRRTAESVAADPMGPRHRH